MAHKTIQSLAVRWFYSLLQVAIYAIIKPIWQLVEIMNSPAVYDGKYVSLQDICCILGHCKTWLGQKLKRESRWLSEVKAMGFSGEVVDFVVPRKQGTRGASSAKTLSQKDFNLLLTYEACLGNPYAAQALTGNRVAIKTRERKSEEREAQLKLAKTLSGEIEVATRLGRIDVLTPEEIIEVKLWGGWKCALGQILVYGDYYPNHRKKIHCCGRIPVDIAEIKKHLDKHDVCLSWEV
jgi:hypothetical protein